ncbi:MAG: T9SS type A sorting domain-containing protein [Bacteroidota bacterium]|nr:T9SS type A sorting domain-containing protein [Bacteroidota bacterium]
MKKIILLIVFSLSILNSIAQFSNNILINTYRDYEGFVSPIYTNINGVDIQSTFLPSNPVLGFTGEYEINIGYHYWYNDYQLDHLITYSLELVSFPFTLNCAFGSNTCATCQSTERHLELPNDNYDPYNKKWGQYLFSDIENGRFNSGGNSELDNGWHQTLVTDFFNKTFNPNFVNRKYLPHSIYKLTLYLHCTNDPVNPGPVISSISYIIDNTRGRMRYYPFKEDNCPGSSEANYDVIIRPLAILDPNDIMPYADNASNQSWTNGIGSINYFKTSEIDINGCNIPVPSTTDDFYWLGQFWYPFPGPTSLHVANAFNSEGKTLAGYNSVTNQNQLLVKNEGLLQSYFIQKEFEFSILNTPIIYNPSEVTLLPGNGQNYFNMVFPEGINFRTIRGAIPSVVDVDLDNIIKNGGPFYDSRDVPVRTDLRSENPNDPKDENNSRHSVYSSRYYMEPGSQITIEPCVGLFDMSFDVKPGATLLLQDYTQIRGIEDGSNNITGRFKIIGKGGAILRNFSETQYIQNGDIVQTTPLSYIATSHIVAGENVDPDTDQSSGIYEIKAGANVTFTAGDYIHLTNGFYVSGGDFHAVINENMPIPPICYPNTIQNGGNRTMQQSSADQKQHIDSISLLPNPNQGTFTISINGNNSIIAVSLFDITGRCIYYQNKLNERSHEIQLNSDQSGLLIAKVENEVGEIRIIKVIVE